MAEAPKSDFFIEIDFKKDSESPARVFETMAGLIKAFENFDKDLIKSIDNKIEPVMLLEDIEVGSLRAWLVNFLRGIPDEAIADLDWKKLIGHYLVKGKHILIKKLEGKTIITDGNVIEDIQFELIEEAKKTNVKLFPNYAPIQLPTLIENIDNINKALAPLNKQDVAIYKSEYGTASFNLELNFTPESIEDLITKERIETNSQMILKIKKPDYLGNTMWDFKHGNRLIQGKIIDGEWLVKFQERQIDIRPGDSLRATVKTVVKYGYDLEVVGYHYDIIKVVEVIQAKTPNQGNLELGETE